ncbi:MAG: hypothetical protein HYS77_08395 [Candidatus Rokubacteria bacterium]|nr:hypothetical protein [Candidatus Rokubacteria bacterium]
MTDHATAAPAAATGRLAQARKRLGGLRLAYLPVLMTYFCYGASGVTGVALLFFQKEALQLTPAEAAGIGFWLGLPWSMKMVAGVASDVYPIFGSRRGAYLLLGAALLVGSISVGYLSGWLAGHIGTRATFGVAMLLPLLVAASVPFIRLSARALAAPPGAGDGGPLGGGKARLVLGVGLAYAAFTVALEALAVPFGQELVLVVSAALIGLLLHRVGISRAVVIAAIVIFLFRATPGVGQGYSYWAIDKLGFDQTFLGLLAQVSSILSLAGLLVFRKTIVTRPVSFTLGWVIVAGTVLYLPNIGLFYGLNEWLGLSARTFAFIDTTIAAPLAQLTMVPMLILIAKTAPRGAEATMFAIMASLMNLALSASELFTRYLNSAFDVTQADYSSLGRLMITVGALGLVPLLALPLLRKQEHQL